MARSNFEPVRLVVQASDPGTEIFVVDGRLNRIASGSGYLDVEVEPGLYKVRLRSGSTQRDELVSVEPNAGQVVLRPEAVEFRSAAPLMLTQTTHEYHGYPAEGLSRGTGQRLGRGSGLFLFLREEDPDAPKLRPDTVSVLDLAENELSQLRDGEADPQWGWAGLNLEVDPGTYRIRVDTGPLGSYDLFVTTAAEWQTQVFLTTEDFAAGDSTVRSPSLRMASLFMAPWGAGFEQGRPESRISELARQSLAQGRQALGQKELQHLLRGKFQDPMLGVYGAHLLLLERRIRWSLLEEVCRNLFGMIGPHPDLQAIQLRLQDESPGPSGKGPIEGVPTLRRSWDLIVAASKRRPSLVPQDSVLATVARDMASAQPFLLYRADHQPSVQVRELSPSVPISREAALRQAVGFLKAGPIQIPEILARTETEEISLSSLERALLGTMISSTADLGEAEIEEESIQGRLRRAMEGVRAPPSAVSGSLASLVEKLEGF